MRIRSVARALLVVMCALVFVPASFSMGAPEQSPTITVVGEGTVTAAPDQASVTVGVQLYNQSAPAAAADLATRMQSVIDAIRALGIPDRQIQTMNYSIYFERDFQTPLSPSTGNGSPVGSYRVENMVRVTIDDVNRAADVVEAAINAGANQMYGIEFTFSNPRELDDQARSSAMDDAKRRADALAAAAGRSVGDALEITEVVGSGDQPYQAKTMAVGVVVQPGESSYTARIQVTYALK